MTQHLDGTAVRQWLVSFEETIQRYRDELTDLDRRAGDGDFGTNVSAALRAARQTLLGTADAETLPAQPFETVSDAFMDMGGTSGPLFGMWFAAYADAAGERATIGLPELAGGARAGLQAVRRLGKAEPGDKTMVDAMAPAADALESVLQAAPHSAPQSAPETTPDAGPDSLRDGLAGAAEAARKAALATATMTARRGRASYVGEAAEGVVDAGAFAVALFFESAAALFATE